MYDSKREEEKYGKKTAGEYIRKSYKGGWCYLVEGKEEKLFEKAITQEQRKDVICYRAYDILSLASVLIK